MALTIPALSPKQSARLAATLNSAPLTWMWHEVALRNGMTPGSRRWLSAPRATKSRAPCGRMSSPYFIGINSSLAANSPASIHFVRERLT